MAGAVACIDVGVEDRELCIRVPGGVTLCASPPGIIAPPPDELAQYLMGSANAALAPLNPIFDLINAIVSIKDALLAIPTFDFPTLLEAVETLTESITNLASVVPAVSVPVLILDMMTMLLKYLQGTLDKLEAMLEQEQRIAEARNLAIEEGLTDLLTSVECAEEQMAQLMEGLQSSAGPIGNIITLMNNLGSLIGLPPIEFDLGGDNVQETIDSLTELVDTLVTIRDAIPV